MIKVKLASLVEGDGEVGAVPVLLRRIINSIDPTVIPIVPRGFRHPSGSIRRPGGLERAISAVSEIHAGHAILVLIDSDDDCPSDLGRELRNRQLCRVRISAFRWCWPVATMKRNRWPDNGIWSGTCRLQQTPKQSEMRRAG